MLTLTSTLIGLAAVSGLIYSSGPGLAAAEAASSLFGISGVMALSVLVRQFTRRYGCDDSQDPSWK
ncbi:hypothetical protein E0K89_008715 [Aquicoccus sp. SCR17]|nr:hypothetical protein [Carideicomes alvinocaridis]